MFKKTKENNNCQLYFKEVIEEKSVSKSKIFFKKCFESIFELKEATIITIFIVAYNREFNYIVFATLFSFLYLTIISALVSTEFELNQIKSDIN